MPVLLLLALAITLPEPVRAQTTCTCATSVCPGNDSPFFRVNVAPFLAPNARILARLSQWDSASVGLTTSAGTEVPFTLEAAGDASGSAFWISPAAPLAPGRYVLSATASTPGRAAARQEFVVEPGDDVTPPPISGLRVRGAIAADYCNDLVGATITWDAGVDSDVFRSVFAAEVELARDGVMFARLFPAQPGFGTATEIGTSPTPDCLGSAHVDGLIEGEELTARVRVWDMAGNATEFESATFNVSRSPGVPSCGQACTATPGRAGPRAIGAWLGVALVIAALWRRRRCGRAGGPRHTSRPTSDGRRLRMPGAPG